MSTTASHQILSINPASLKVLRTEIDAALASVAEKYGVTMKATSGSYDGNSGSLKVEIALRGENGEELGKEGQDFKTYAKLVGMEPEWLGKSFDHYGTHYTIVGYKPKAQKNDVIVKTRQGARYVLSHLAVIAGMNKVK